MCFDTKQMRDYVYIGTLFSFSAFLYYLKACPLKIKEIYAKHFCIDVIQYVLEDNLRDIYIIDAR